MVVSETGTSGYGNLLPTAFSVSIPEWWAGIVLIFMCVLIFLYFLLISAKRLEAC
jgi:TRAP-type C4-dicarboxylate transport system permease small subunit